MRPVLLELDGFASFREPTLVDFRHADYFALVGPTGAGKSTIIDALTFALYGSVPRWDNPRTVGLALAPTVLRGIVRFVFDVAGHGGVGGRTGGRYVVARELRRAASGSVSVRTARLERLRDAAGTGSPEEETEPVADGAVATTRAVEELLGLPFTDFTTCVVLPQGAFAEFLHTEPRKRQDTLVRLLGLGVYDLIAKEANAEAKVQEQRAQVLAEQLGGYADATAEAEQDAAARVGALDALRGRVETAGKELVAEQDAFLDAAALVATLADGHARLTALVPRPGLADLSGRQRAAAATLAEATGRAAAADAADTAAHEILAAGPARAPLELARRDHVERAEVATALPPARARHAGAVAAAVAATRSAAAARAAVEEARRTRDAAAAHLAGGRETVRRLAAERDLLLAVRVPPGSDALGERAAAAAAALAAADTGLAAAEQTDEEARTAVAAAAPRAPLEQARRDLAELDAALLEQGAAAAAAAAAQRAGDAAGERAAAARGHLDHVRRRRAAAARADLAAALRPALAVGDDCPVCAQRVAALPATLPGGDLAAAEHDLALAEAGHDTAQRAEAAAAAAAIRAATDVGTAHGRVEQLTAALGLSEGCAAGAAVSAEAVDAALRRLDALAVAARDADAACRRARAARTVALRAVEGVGRDVSLASAAVRAARDPLVPLGAPAVDDAGAPESWVALGAWATAAAGARAEALAAARADVVRAEDVSGGAEAGFTAAGRVADERRLAETAAVRAEQAAAEAVERLEQRGRALVEALRDAPDLSTALAELDRLTEREETVRACGVAARSARDVLRGAEREVAEVQRELATTWEALRAARDPLVTLGAPAPSGEDVAVAWAGMVRWAGRAARDTAARLDGARAAHAEHAAGLAAVGARLVADLAEHSVASPGVERSVGEAGAAVATALERARGALQRVAERRRAASSLLDDRERAVQAQQVARMLGQLLRSDGFPRWLVASALDALVADASLSLAELSGGQFELAHEHGEFLVVDHADADTRRPVKTLSGGETFQASLALALALSAQLSGLAAHGAARLESIFLDEGFGTLDATNLETVAGTLETLAARGDRVVGVITHVPALAERVPVRFAVRRDHRTSSVTREDG